MADDDEKDPKQQFQYHKVTEKEVAYSIELESGIVADFDEKDAVVGFEVTNAEADGKLDVKAFDAKAAIAEAKKAVADAKWKPSSAKGPGEK